MEGCAHHWLLPSPTPGCETVEARCKVCDAVKSMPAYFDEDIFVKQSRMTPGRRAFIKAQPVIVYPNGRGIHH